MALRSDDRTGRDRVLGAVYAGLETLFFLLLMGGIFTAVLGQRLGAYLMVAGLVGTLLNHLWLGVVGYRRVMARPWPEVEPLEDEDDDWGARLPLRSHALVTSREPDVSAGPGAPDTAAKVGNPRWVNRVWLSFALVAGVAGVLIARGLWVVAVPLAVVGTVVLYGLLLLGIRLDQRDGIDISVWVTRSFRRLGLFFVGLLLVYAVVLLVWTLVIALSGD